MKRSGKKRHYIPAAFLGNFSSTSQARLRKRKLWVLRKGKEEIYQRTSANCAYINNLYGNYMHDIDYSLAISESEIINVIKNLSTNNSKWFNANDWGILCSFITELFAKSPDFQETLNKRFKAIFKTNDLSKLEKYLNIENADMGRLLEYQRISAAVLRARWQFIEVKGNNLVTNDRGMAGMYSPDWKSDGIVIPLNPEFGVMLGTGPFQKQMKYFNQCWHINIPTVKINIFSVNRLNEAIYAFSRNETYSNNKDELSRIIQLHGYNPEPVEDNYLQYICGGGVLGLTSKERIKDELLLIKLLSGIKPPTSIKQKYMRV